MDGFEIPPQVFADVPEVEDKQIMVASDDLLIIMIAVLI